MSFLNNRFLFLPVIVFAIFNFLLLPPLLRKGMFFDGLIYATVSRNMSIGLGSFWKPHWMHSVIPEFYGHPPLAFGLQALFFKVFNDHWWVERLYSYISALICIFLIGLTWKLLYEKNKSKQNFFWLPVLFWITVPVVFWSFANNMLENTLTVFMLLAVYFQLLIRNISVKSFVFTILSAVAIFLGFLTKGPVALFPLITIAFTAIITGLRLREIIVLSLLQGICCVLLFYLLIQYLPAESFFTNYYNDQIKNSIDQTYVTVASRWFILKKLFFNLLPAIIIVILLLGYSVKYLHRRIERVSLRHVTVFAGIGLAGSVPIVITLKQSGFYIVPVYPFFAIGAAILCLDPVYYYINRIQLHKIRMLNIIAFIFFALSWITAPFISNMVQRDLKYISEAEKLSALIPAGTVAAACPDIWQDRSLQNYLMRYGQINIAHYELPEAEYYFANEVCKQPECHLIYSGMYKLYYCKQIDK